MVEKKKKKYLDTVAGEATFKSSTSNTINCKGVSRIISPEVRHNFLLSSSTVFIFSIQTASTGPSNTYQCKKLSEPDVPARNNDEKIPSVLEFVNKKFTIKPC